MNYVNRFSLSSPDLRIRNYFLRAMMGEADRPSHLALIKGKNIDRNINKVQDLTNLMGIYEATYSIVDDYVTFESYIPLEDSGDIYQVAFLTGNLPGDEVVTIENITPLEKTDQYSLDFKVVLQFNA